MKVLCFQRQHQKLDDMSVAFPERNNLDGESDTSCGSGHDSGNSYDPSSFTHDATIGDPLTVRVGLLVKTKAVKNDHPGSHPETSTTRRFWKLGWGLNLKDKSAKRRSKALAELDRTIMQIRRNNIIMEKCPSKNANANNNAIDFDLLNQAMTEPALPREVTWKRRVSSLEAIFKKDAKSKYACNRERSLESTIIKPIPLEYNSGGLNAHDNGSWDSLTKDFRSKHRRKSTFEETVEQGVSDILGKITSRGEEILENVPDWSVASSSVDFMSTATSDDDVTSISGYRQRDLSSTPTHESNSTSSEDDYFSMETGCNSIESCKMMTNEIGTMLGEMIPHPSSIFECYTIGKRRNTTKHRKSKRL